MKMEKKSIQIYLLKEDKKNLAKSLLWKNYEVI